MSGIIAKNNDYIVKVKGNQLYLHQEIMQIVSGQSVQDEYCKRENNRARKEKRHIKTYKVSDFIRQNWPGAKTVVVVERKRKVKGRISTTQSYYLSSLKDKAKVFAQGIRHHWGIENRLHYIKDVCLLEDSSKIKTGNAPGIMSLIRNLVINLARLNGANEIKKFMRKTSGNIQLISVLLE